MFSFQCSGLLDLEPVSFLKVGHWDFKLSESFDRK